MAIVIEHGRESVDEYLLKQMGPIFGSLGEHGQLRFTCWQECPRCHVLDTHWLDEPKIPTPEAYLNWSLLNDKFLKDPGVLIEAFGVGVVRQIGGFPKPEDLVDESMFEVMRICRNCGHRWGNV